MTATAPSSQTTTSPRPLVAAEESSRSSTIVDPQDRDDVNSEFEREAYGPPPGEKDADPFEVRIPLDDPEHPQTWSRWYRWYLTMFAGLLLLNATFASSVPTGIEKSLEEYFTFSEEVALLLISVFVAGYCVGPLVWGPLSEQIGRRPVFILTFIPYTAFQVGCALSRNTASILVFRFLTGVFASAPLANAGALISDVWDVGTRGKALALYTLMPFAGPSLGPLVSGFMSDAGISWRWVFWLLTMFSGACLAVCILTVPETYLPVLLVRKAKRLRKETGDDRYWAPLEKQNLAIGPYVRHTLGRPFHVLFKEPMLFSMSMYMSFVYGCIYLLFEAFPIVFTEGHHLNEGVGGLTFLAVFSGACTGVLTYVVYFNPKYLRQMEFYKPDPVPPEVRLEVCMWASPGLVISFFWFAWTSYPTISLWAPLMACYLLGWSVVYIFLGLYNYIIDTYLFVAASALSAMTVMRSIFGATFPLFATQMYNTLNPRWASTVLGFIAILLGPIPFVLYKFGPALRHRSKFSPSEVYENSQKPNKAGEP